MKTKNDLGTLAIAMNLIARRAYRVLRQTGELDEVDVEAEAYAVLEAISLIRGQLPDREFDDLHRWMERLQVEIECLLRSIQEGETHSAYRFSDNRIGAL
jgi:hypothetical protein